MKGIEYLPVPIKDIDISAKEIPGLSLISTETVVLQGDKIGEMICRIRHNGLADYHAVLQVNGDGLGPVSGLAQGHGKNRAEAIADALSKSRAVATNFLASLNHLAQRINCGEVAATNGAA
ncbi:hypothetical protein [uncultured Microbulbifer sp.]|uniref:hypothetical protein n=1 Tax=uncultured Microbulbifer sp. TaxID=348147 RepID=UPI002604BE80|nr:hypothetical protein [uncultured Microbulbifer sp.]